MYAHTTNIAENVFSGHCFSHLWIYGAIHKPNTPKANKQKSFVTTTSTSFIRTSYWDLQCYVQKPDKVYELQKFGD